MCRSLTLAGRLCTCPVPGVDGRCWHHLSPEERQRWGYAAKQGAGRPIGTAKTEVADSLADEPPLRRLPRLALEAVFIEKLALWAEEFDALDDDRYTAQSFIEWVLLEHKPRRRAVTDVGPPSYPVIGIRMEGPHP